jgi:hypothetical protein
MSLIESDEEIVSLDSRSCDKIPAQTPPYKPTRKNFPKRLVRFILSSARSELLLLLNCFLLLFTRMVRSHRMQELPARSRAPRS